MANFSKDIVRAESIIASLKQSQASGVTHAAGEPIEQAIARWERHVENLKRNNQ